MRAKFAASLATLQFIFLLMKGFSSLVGWPMSWFVVLFPLWTLLGIAVLFWVVLGGLVKAAS